MVISWILRPYLHNCLYCDVEYDVIGQLEEYGEDMLYIAMRQNLTSQMKDLTKVKNKTARKKESSSLKILDYMSQIPQDNRNIVRTIQNWFGNVWLWIHSVSIEYQLYYMKANSDHVTLPNTIRWFVLYIERDARFRCTGLGQIGNYLFPV